MTAESAFHPVYTGIPVFIYPNYTGRFDCFLYNHHYYIRRVLCVLLVLELNSICVNNTVLCTTG